MTKIEQDPNSCLEIPDHWQFPEKRAEGLRKLQVDLKHRFLAFEFPNPPSWAHRIIGAQYFFDIDGNITDLAEYEPLGEVKIRLLKNDGITSFNQNEFETEVEFFKPNPSREETSRKSDIMLASATFFGSKRPIFWEKSFLGLKSIGLESNFGSDEDGNMIEAPFLVISKTNTEYNETKGSYWELSDYDITECNLINIGNNNFNFQNRQNGKSLFNVHWIIKNGGIILRQSHLPTKTTKSLHVPLVISAYNFEKAAFSSPTYDESPSGIKGISVLDVPWRNIDKIVGASLSYSSPRKKTQSAE